MQLISTQVLMRIFLNKFIISLILKFCYQSYTKVSATRQKIAGQNQKCLICGESHSHKGFPNKETRKSKCANCKGPHVASYKGCPEYKKQELGSMW